jgi:hypothetical protein
MESMTPPIPSFFKAPMRVEKTALASFRRDFDQPRFFTHQLVVDFPHRDRAGTKAAQRGASTRRVVFCRCDSSAAGEVRLEWLTGAGVSCPVEPGKWSSRDHALRLPIYGQTPPDWSALGIGCKNKGAAVSRGATSNLTMSVLTCRSTESSLVPEPPAESTARSWPGTTVCSQ